ncbi:type II toxin-antitoxin system ParD family antitoxin [Haliea salexigens]|uniref:type II toxin-antitoxin system ParD family antitoxin n=1 Tax=Haliea salexigens TaxID=287487 RepID=UPI0030846183
MNTRRAIWQRQVLALASTGKFTSRMRLPVGRYGSASEVVRDALRAMEERKSKLDALRSHLAQGADQARARASEFIDNFTMDTLINGLDNEA